MLLEAKVMGRIFSLHCGNLKIPKNFTPKYKKKHCVRLHHVKIATAVVPILYFPVWPKNFPPKEKGSLSSLLESVVSLGSTRIWFIRYCASRKQGQNISHVHWDIGLWRPEPFKGHQLFWDHYAEDTHQDYK